VPIRKIRELSLFPGWFVDGYADRNIALRICNTQPFMSAQFMSAQLVKALRGHPTLAWPPPRAYATADWGLSAWLELGAKNVNCAVDESESYLLQLP
jgi:hypothetical protein